MKKLICLSFISFLSAPLAMAAIAKPQDRCQQEALARVLASQSAKSEDAVVSGDLIQIIQVPGTGYVFVFDDTEQPAAFFVSGGILSSNNGVILSCDIGKTVVDLSAVDKR
ncbi:MAG: hypothetical protein P4M08_16165 [Oligoflexia bacterium]|nr:hypothetical protein [Oligoflexia bacterium]